MANASGDRLLSCDTFVALPPATLKGSIVFGKNSDRPTGEVQELVYVPAADYDAGSKVKCTYIEIPQVPHTHAVILSKPSWMWGAEMGSNEFGVCIGNEAVWTKLNGPADHDEKLLGMDLLRLGLERGSTAQEALDVIGAMLTVYGQGGPCSDTITSFTYHNSFLIADRKEAWVLETAGKLWAAERITSGVRNISNCLTIGTKIDAMSPNLKTYAEQAGLWKPADGEFNFTKVYGEQDGSDCYRLNNGRRMLERLSASGSFGLTDMFSVLRDKRSGINMNTSTTGSQVSVLAPVDSSQPSCHWFTATPDPAKSVFKPFIFCPDVRTSPHTQSPIYSETEDPAKVKPRFKKTVDRRHNLYKLHENAVSRAEDSEESTLFETLQDLESRSMQDMQKFLDSFNESGYQEVQDLLKDVVESEMKFYK